MDNITEIKFCKNKKCRKVLPEDYKYKYCEACRNRQAYWVKDIAEKAPVVLAVGSIVASIIHIFDNNPDSEEKDNTNFPD